MAPTGSGDLLSRRNIRLDSFLKRNTERDVYERIRAYEPCVVISEGIDKVYMHVVLSDERVYLTEYPPRTLTTAFSFRRVRDIELVNDLPDFLSGKDREFCQHIRISYVTVKPAVRGRDWLKRTKKEGLPSARRNSLCPTVTSSQPIGYPAHRNHIEPESERHALAPTRSASCPNSESLGLPSVINTPTPSPTASFFSSPPSPSDQRLTIPELGQVQRSIGTVLSRLMGREGVSDGEERGAELHLYAVSQKSKLYLHLLSAWNSCIIRSTLLMDPLYRRRCSTFSDSSPAKQPPAISWDRTAHLLSQLGSELLQPGISVESLYLLLQELQTAARRDVALRRLFWRSTELCVFLVQTLEETLHGRHSLTADQLLLSTLIVQTLAVMFRETEVEQARLTLLSAKKGALASRMLLALMCDPDQCPPTALLSEYLDAACSLLFELLLLGQEASRSSSGGNFLSVGWILRVLQPNPHLTWFVGHQAGQVVAVLSEECGSLSPLQCVLLYQRSRLLLLCLQHSAPLAQYLRSTFTEEFRYSVKLSSAEEKLPPHYPISQPTLRLVEQILHLQR